MTPLFQGKEREIAETSSQRERERERDVVIQLPEMGLILHLLPL